MQPETRSLPQRASHRPQSRDTPRVLLNQASREPQPAIRPFSANIHRPTENNQVRHTDHFVGLTSSEILKSYMWAICLHSVSLLRVNISLQRGWFPQFSSLCLRNSTLYSQILHQQHLITVWSSPVLLTPSAPLLPLLTVSRSRGVNPGQHGAAGWNLTH